MVDVSNSEKGPPSSTDNSSTSPEASSISPATVQDQLTAGAVALAWLDLERAMIGPGSDVVTAARTFLRVVEMRDKFSRDAYEATLKKET